MPKKKNIKSRNNSNSNNNFSQREKQFLPAGLRGDNNFVHNRWLCEFIKKILINSIWFHTPDLFKKNFFFNLKKNFRSNFHPLWTKRTKKKIHQKKNLKKKIKIDPKFFISGTFFFGSI